MISHSGTGDLSTSLALSVAGRGHVGRIGSRPADEFSRPTFAAGALLWREDKKRGLQVAVIHRPRYDDWSLPKGKVDPGESLPQTAVREIVEETGFTTELGWLLGYVHYPVGSRTKVVYYWTAEVTGGAFTANEECDELRWVSPDEAHELLTYDIDRDVLDAGKALLALGCDRRVLYVRHAKAHRREGWHGDDNLRPLTKKGRRQSEMLVPLLSAYGPVAVASAEPVRCVNTVEPLAQDLGLDVSVEANLGDAGWELSSEIALEAFERAASGKKVSVIVGQGTVIPGIVSRLAGHNGFEVEDLRVKKSSVWVLHYRGEELLGVDYLASPLPVK